MYDSGTIPQVQSYRDKQMCGHVWGGRMSTTVLLGGHRLDTGIPQNLHHTEGMLNVIVLKCGRYLSWASSLMN